MRDFIKSIFAGLMIGIAGSIFLNVDNKIASALLFSIGLIIICLRGYNLYTGKIGYIKSVKDLPKMFLYIIGNLFGVFLISLTTKTSSNELILQKLNIPWHLTLLKSIGCGFLMFLAVDIYKQKESVIGILCCIPAFILAGFEHSIADLFYICCGNIYNLEVLKFIFIVIVGNAVGALLHKSIE